MAAWVWLVAYILGFALLQVALYRYFRRGKASPSGADRPTVTTESPPGGGNEDGVHCGRCGAYNEATYTYCRQCADEL
jgi:hypothetical protein